MEENTGNQGSEKTFTQAEVDAIVSDRLKRERMKTADYEDLKTKAEKWDAQEEASKTELQKATEKADELQRELDALKTKETVRTMRETISSETGVPVKLLTATTEEECRAQAADLSEFIKSASYPSVPDAGEATVTGKQNPRDAFADWFNKL